MFGKSALGPRRDAMDKSLPSRWIRSRLSFVGRIERLGRAATALAILNGSGGIGWVWELVSCLLPAAIGLSQRKRLTETRSPQAAAFCSRAAFH